MSTVIDTSGKSRNLGTNFWLVLLGLSLIVFIANTGYAIYKARLLSGASTAASSLQVNSQKLANQGREAVSGNADSFAAFKATRQQINSDIGALNTNYGQALRVHLQVRRRRARAAEQPRLVDRVAGVRREDDQRQEQQHQPEVGAQVAALAAGVHHGAHG